MNKFLQLPRFTLFLSAVFLSLSASAQTADAQLRYQQELAHCKSGPATQSLANCQREAGAALAAAKRGDLDDGPAAYERNARERCMALPTPERYECIARMRAPASGSVAGGGLLREAVTVEAIAPPAPPAPPAQPMK
ncbi:hypothetical protein LNV09_20240 [Paucibacter sp. B2R-40]|uniref:hypothetical protein n=1 Tax=Paucibacter sp. B2R-40 TaxID=2893554 RepID=UPI0021E3B667|nr:hypothetical protein [Paucibacter sp. B2R-40]MCV2356477.1 hypothetical protein [Paucibacter sp. B2R-40]